MGAATLGEYDPFADDEPEPHSLVALQEMAELLEMVRYWRTEAERLAHDYEWIAQQNRRRYEAKKAFK